MPDPNYVDVGNDRLRFPIARGDGTSWLAAYLSSPLFAVFLGERVLAAHTPGVLVETIATDSTAGKQTTRVRYRFPGDGVEVVQHMTAYEGSALVETWQSVRNMSTAAIDITRLDSLALDLAPAEYELLSFTSDWGLEFESVRAPLEGDVRLETRRGRSSRDHHPWFALFRGDGAILSGSVAWSGNWIFRFERQPDGMVRLSGGLNDWEFSHTLAPGASFDSAPVVVAPGTHGDLNSVSTQYARVGRAHWYPRNALSDRLPVEWNQWWSYEDRTINEQVFRANVDVAARLGVEVCTMDAGWFGPTDPTTHWYDYRGDFGDVNTARFPSGIRALSDYTHDHGMAFGLWCEIEAVGKSARLAEVNPDFLALRDGLRLGYLCFGAPAVQEWAFALLSRMIDEYRLDWIKLDFNLDPGAGCDRTDHGHAAGDGLYQHYAGYYATLERVRASHPEVVLENCSSGGQRIDLGILRRTSPTFLSDPDWPEHGLQLIWGASTTLAPNAWLHWGYSEWITEHRCQKFNPRDPALLPHQLDYYIRIGMLGGYGFSQKLPDLPDWVAARWAEHITLYKSTLRRFVREADFYRLTEQPRRFGQGERWAAFQYCIPNGADHLVAIFRLPGGEPERTIRLYGLEPDRQYSLKWLLDDRTERRQGADLLAHGLRCADLPEEGSALLLLR